MSEPEETIIPPEGIALGLGALSDATYDTRLSTQASAPPDADRLDLPQNALVALRKSGGLRFSSRTVTILRSGWAIQELQNRPVLRPRRVAPTALAALRRLTLRARLGSLPNEIGRSSPDGFTYELAARIGRNVHHVTLHDGSIPTALEPLLRTLTRLLPTA